MRPAPANSEDAHGSEDRPALAAVLHHLAKAVDQRRADHQHGEDVEEVADRVRVFERMGGIDVEEAAAIGAQLLDRLLARHRPERDGLLAALERGRHRRSIESVCGRPSAMKAMLKTMASGSRM